MGYFGLPGVKSVVNLTKIGGQTKIEAPAAPAVAVCALAPLYVPANLPLPAPMEYKGNVYSNWKYFKMQWEDYENSNY